MVKVKPVEIRNAIEKIIILNFIAYFQLFIFSYCPTQCIKHAIRIIRLLTQTLRRKRSQIHIPMKQIRCRKDDIGRCIPYQTFIRFVELIVSKGPTVGDCTDRSFPK